jgi:phospho-N-acetylmuramoyl-pentapeptide-transferase
MYPAGVFQYITLDRTAFYFLLLLSTVLVKRIINFTKPARGETVRELGLAGQNEKGNAYYGRSYNHICYAFCYVVFETSKYLYRFIDCYDFVDGNNWFIDDYIKFKKDKEGLKGILKFWAVGLGLIVVVLYFSPNVTVRTDTGKNDILKHH